MTDDILTCPFCGTPTHDGWVDTEAKPGDDWESHYVRVTCECGEQYEIVYSASDILFWESDGGDPKLASNAIRPIDRSSEA